MMRSDESTAVPAARGSLLGVMAAAIVALSGCNSITGVGGLEVKNDGETTGTEASSSTGDPPPIVCEYPTEGFGDMIGDVVPLKEWQGFVDASTEPSTVSMKDYHDCAGEKGINALIVDTSATWCGACQQEAAEFAQKFQGAWGSLGIRVITLMIEDTVQGEPATLDTALNWKKEFNLDSTVAVDPPFTFAPVANSSVIGLPLVVVVDPRTMKMVDVQQGYPFDETVLSELAKTNQGK
jgi:hypothetical protein